MRVDEVVDVKRIGRVRNDIPEKAGARVRTAVKDKAAAIGVTRTKRHLAWNQVEVLRRARGGVGVMVHLVHDLNTAGWLDAEAPHRGVVRTGIRLRHQLLRQLFWQLPAQCRAAIPAVPIRPATVSQAGELESGASGLVPHYTNLDEFFHTRVSQMLTPDYLKAAFKHYRSTAHENEGGEASEKAHAGPGEKRKVPLLTRANLLPEMEFFDHDQGFTPLNLSVAKLASLATSQGFWKPHSMFVSGTTQKTSPVCQNIWFRIRRDRSKAARMDWMNKLLYGPEYGPEDDMAIEQALTAHNDGPAPSVTNPLTYAECVLAFDPHQCAAHEPGATNASMATQGARF